MSIIQISGVGTFSVFLSGLLIVFVIHGFFPLSLIPSLFLSRLSFFWESQFRDTSKDVVGSEVAFGGMEHGVEQYTEEELFKPHSIRTCPAEKTKWNRDEEYDGDELLAGEDCVELVVDQISDPTAQPPKRACRPEKGPTIFASYCVIS